MKINYFPSAKKITKTYNRPFYLENVIVMFTMIKEKRKFYFPSSVNKQSKNKKYFPPTKCMYQNVISQGVAFKIYYSFIVLNFFFWLCQKKKKDKSFGKLSNKGKRKKNCLFMLKDFPYANVLHL